MIFLPRSLCNRLVLGLVVVSAIAIGAGAFYLYSRFHDAHSPFYEGTLQLFSEEIAKGLSIEDGKVAVPYRSLGGCRYHRRPGGFHRL